jgi:hypothetical protein
MNIYLLHTERSWPMKILSSGNSPEEAVEKYAPGRVWKHKIVSKDGMDRLFTSNQGWIQIHLVGANNGLWNL